MTRTLFFLPGSGASPVASSTVTVSYVGKHLDNTLFDTSTSPLAVPLSSVIDGWKTGLPFIKKGGRIKMVIPSALAYACAGNLPVIQPNEPLFFDVTLNDVK